MEMIPNQLSSYNYLQKWKQGKPRGIHLPAADTVLYLCSHDWDILTQHCTYAVMVGVLYHSVICTQPRWWFYTHSIECNLLNSPFLRWRIWDQQHYDIVQWHGRETKYEKQSIAGLHSPIFPGALSEPPLVELHSKVILCSQLCLRSP